MTQIHYHVFCANKWHECQGLRIHWSWQSDMCIFLFTWKTVTSVWRSHITQNWCLVRALIQHDLRMSHEWPLPRLHTFTTVTAKRSGWKERYSVRHHGSLVHRLVMSVSFFFFGRLLVHVIREISIEVRVSWGIWTEELAKTVRRGPYMTASTD